MFPCWQSGIIHLDGLTTQFAELVLRDLAAALSSPFPPGGPPILGPFRFDPKAFNEVGFVL